MFDITPEPEQQLIRATLFGFWKLDTAQRFEAEMKTHIQQLLKNKPWFDLLVDLRDVQPVSPEVNELNSKIMADQIAMGLRKSANIVSSTLLGMQVRRVAGDGRFQTFSSEEEARAWLAE